MEISFVVSCLRRYWWLAVLGLATGIGGALVVRSSAPSQYMALAALQVSPPSSSSFDSANNDRYVAAQLQVLGSASFATTIATKVGDGLSAANVHGATTIVQVPGSDIVNVEVTESDPTLAQTVANTYVDLYIAQVQTEVDKSAGNAIDPVTRQLDALKTSLATVDSNIAKAMAPYLNQKPGAGGNYPQIPLIDQVAPDLASQKQVLLGQFSAVQTALTTMQATSNIRVVSRIIQRATLPTSPIMKSRTKYAAAVALAGAFLGLACVLLLGRRSRRVLDSAHVEEILGQSIFGHFPSVPVRDRSDDLLSVSKKVGYFVDALCIRAESASERSACVSIVVAGGERRSGTTSLAAAMASRCWSMGLRTLLLDADVAHRDVSTHFLDTSVGLRQLLAPVVPGNSSRVLTASDQPLPISDLDDGSAGALLQVVNIHNDLDAMRLRRADARQLLKTLGRLVDVVIVDGGYVAGSSSTARLATAADVLVLAVPVRHQRVATLNLAQEETSGLAGLRLVVTTSSVRQPEERSSRDHTRAAKSHEPETA